MPKIGILVTAFLGLILATRPAAGPSRLVKALHLDAELLADVAAVSPGKPFRAGVRLVLEPGWHVYWKNPGDAGLPVSLAWSLPEGFRAGNMRWPYPRKVAMGSLANYGYKGEVVFPVDIAPPASLGRLSGADLQVEVEYLVCKQICLPGKALIRRSLPVHRAGGEPPPAPSEAVALLGTALGTLPITPSGWSFRAQSRGTAFTLFLDAKGPASGPAPALHFFPEEPDLLAAAAEQRIRRSPGGYSLELPLLAGAAPPDTLAGVLVSDRSWTDGADRKAAIVRVAVDRGEGGAGMAARAGAAGTMASLLSMLLLAFAGGLILNLMPCVLPVLSLKVFDFIRRAGESRLKALSHGAAFTAGVLLSFWTLAGLLLLLRRGGQQLGWGFQLQSPAFLVILCVLFFLFSLSLFGLFEIGVFFTRLGAGGGDQGHAGSFLSGVTATVVATPCTAPFMGSAMGYAFSQPAGYALLVFTALGLGMAAPYLLLSAFPSLTRFLPKPGAWMETFKQGMGFPLLATAAWLAWVLGKQAGVDVLAALLGVFILAALGAWVLGRWGALHRRISTRVVSGAIAALLILPPSLSLCLFAQRTSAAPAGAVVPASGGIAWEPYSEERLNGLEAEGRPFFIDFTADWCLSCKVNEKVALGDPEVAARFRSLGLVALKADWTRRDETITRALARYGRNSIPLYVLHAGGEPALLPEVITPGIVLTALEAVPPASGSSIADR